MELSGEIEIESTPEQVWLALNDAAVLQQCIPGCEEVRKISDTETQTRVALKLGPVRARFVGKILMSHIRPNQGCTLNFEGSGGAAGFAKGQSTVQLNAAGENTTKLSYTAQASIGGKLGQIGGRMIDASAKQMADQFFSQLKAQLAPSVMPMTSMKEGKSYSTNPVASSSASSSTQNPSSIPTPNPWQAANAGPIVAPASEGLRVLWFALGAASTAFGAILAVMLSR